MLRYVPHSIGRVMSGKSPNRFKRVVEIQTSLSQYIDSMRFDQYVNLQQAVPCYVFREVSFRELPENSLRAFGLGILSRRLVTIRSTLFPTASALKIAGCHNLVGLYFGKCKCPVHSGVTSCLLLNRAITDCSLIA
jgi:hypothetical protein